MSPGDRCICQHSDWWNAFGDKNEEIVLGQRLTVKSRQMVGGSAVLEFEETEPGNLFWAQGFKPMRSLN